MPVCEYTTKSNVQDGLGSEFETVKREVLAKVDPIGHHCLVMRHGKLEIVRFSTFGKTAEGEIFVMFHPISEYSAVRTESCWPSEVHRMNDEDFTWPEDHSFQMGYSVSEIKRVEDCFTAKTITVLMKKLGQVGIGITLRYDSTEEQREFTLIGPEGHICDTDIPFQALCQWVMSDENEDLSEIKEWIIKDYST